MQTETNGESPRRPNLNDAKKILALRNAPLFEAVGEAQLARLAHAAEFLTLERRHAFLHDGKAASVFLVLQGRVRVSQPAGTARGLTLAYHGAGDLVGEGVWSAGAKPLEIGALELSTLLRLPLAEVQRLASEDAAFGRRLFKLLLARKNALEERLTAALQHSVEQRIASLLVDLAAKHAVADERGILLGVRLTHQEIAAYVGSTRETVTVLLTEMKRRGWLIFDHRRIIITDLKALQSL